MTRKIFNILIIDQPQNVFALADFFKNKGFKTFTCIDAAQGFQYLCKIKTDLILVNLVLNGNISGYELCERVKQNPDTCQIPIILLSDRKLPKEIEEAHHIELGTNAFFSRPYNPEELHQTVINLTHFHY